MPKTIQSWLDLVTNNPEIFTVFLSLIVSLVCVSYAKRLHTAKSEEKRKQLNFFGSMAITFVCTWFSYSGPEPLAVAVILTILGPILFSLTIAFVEKRACEKSGMWLHLLGWLKPHRVNPDAAKIHEMNYEGYSFKHAGHKVVAVKDEPKN